MKGGWTFHNPFSWQNSETSSFQPTRYKAHVHMYINCRVPSFNSSSSFQNWKEPWNWGTGAPAQAQGGYLAMGNGNGYDGVKCNHERRECKEKRWWKISWDVLENSSSLKIQWDGDVGKGRHNNLLVEWEWDRPGVVPNLKLKTFRKSWGNRVLELTLFLKMQFEEQG
jgi:hypothetical protein